MEEHQIDPKLIMKDVKDVMAVFAKHKTPLYLSYGAVLGAVRNKDFITWDDDIDFDVIDKIDYKTRKAIGWELFDLGFTPQNIGFNVFGRIEPGEIGYNGTPETGLLVFERNFKFSIFFYERMNNLYVCTPKFQALTLINIPVKFHLNHDKVKLHGVWFETPGPVKEYLAHVYGKDWKTPIRNLHAPNCITGKQKHE